MQSQAQILYVKGLKQKKILHIDPRVVRAWMNIPWELLSVLFPVSLVRIPLQYCHPVTENRKCWVLAAGRVWGIPSYTLSEEYMYTIAMKASIWSVSYECANIWTKILCIYIHWRLYFSYTLTPLRSTLCQISNPCLRLNCRPCLMTSTANTEYINLWGVIWRYLYSIYMCIFDNRYTQYVIDGYRHYVCDW